MMPKLDPNILMVRVTFKGGGRPSYIRMTKGSLDAVRSAFVGGVAVTVVDINGRSHSFANDSIKAITDRIYDPTHM